MIDCRFILQSIVSNQLHHKRKCYCAFTDFQKTFDIIYRNGIWLKLCEIGDSNVNLLNPYIEVSNYAVSCPTALIVIGVKQGEPLSPLLFYFVS